LIAIEVVLQQGFFRSENAFGFLEFLSLGFNFPEPIQVSGGQGFRDLLARQFSG